jgi:disulfide oxidoreductase YuzD
MDKTEFGKRLDQLQASPEMEISRNLQALSASYRVFKKNYDELVSHLEHLKNPRESLFMYSYQQRENLNRLIDETSRLFHNFLASAKSLVDHTRNIVKRLYSNQEFIKEYEAKIAGDIANNSVQQFVQRLRNYTLHYILPIPALQIEFAEDIKMSVRLDVEILKQWDKWGSSRSYLEQLEDSLCLISLSNEYFFLIQNFYQWLTERQTQLHQSDFENLRKMNDELTI